MPVLLSGARPARPVFEVRGRRFDVNDARTTRLDGKPAQYRFAGSLAAALVRPNAPALIRYTLDGSEPAATSPVYTAPLTLTKSCVLKARVFDPRWACGPGVSETAEARFTALAAAQGAAEPPAGAQPGLLTRVYEKKTVLWNNRGFFDAARPMMPDLRAEKPLLAARSRGFELPHAVPSAPASRQCKAFYRFTGWFHAEDPGAYEFAVDSCGPVTLDVAGQAAIEWTGVFHQQQTVRRGEAVLGAGWHPIDLVVCDPLFWNTATVDAMPFSVTVRRDAGEPQAIAAAALRFEPGEAPLASEPVPAWHDATEPGWVEPGVILSVYDRDGKNRDADYLDVDALTPIRAGQAGSINTNVKPGLVRRYEGWFHAPTDGVYTFDLPARRTENAGLGELRAAYQSQLRVDGEIVVQRGVAGRYPLQRAGLKAGWHALSLRMGASVAGGIVTYPDGQSVPLTADLLSRPVLVRMNPGTGGATEIYGPTPVAMSLPPGRASEIHYTLDGRTPEVSDPVCTGTIELDRTAVVCARGFENGHAVTGPARVRFTRVHVPESDLLAAFRFDKWHGKPGDAGLGAGATVWVLPGATVVEGRHGKVIAVNQAAPGANGPAAVDVNLTHGVGTGGFKVAGMKMKENAITVGVWFKSDSATGKLFGKDGYNAFGKSYKTVSCTAQNGQLRGGPGHVLGGKIKPGVWHQVVLSGDEREIVLYLDGKQLATGPGAPTLTTDAFDFFSDHPATVESVRIYNRVLTPADVSQWHGWEARRSEPNPVEPKPKEFGSFHTEARRRGNFVGFFSVGSVPP